MKRMGVILLCFILSLLFVSCDSGDSVDTEVLEEAEVIVMDEKSFHNIKNTVYADGVPFLISLDVELIDDVYSNIYIEVYDKNTEKMWSVRFRDLLKDEMPSDEDIVISENKVLVNCGGYITVHDLLTGRFLWEIETSKVDTGFYVHRGMLYVLYYEEDLMTGINIETGKKEIHIPLSDTNLSMVGIEVDDTSIIVYSKSSINNGRTYTLEGEFVKVTEYNTMKNIVKNVQWNSIEVSSSLDENSKENILDMNKKTFWAEGIKGYGSGEWIEFERTLPTLVNKLVIYNGNHSSLKEFEENAKVKKAVISIGDAKSLKYIFPTPEFGKATVLRFVQPVIADYIYFTIEEAEPGNLYKNTCISDLYTQ